MGKFSWKGNETRNFKWESRRTSPKAKNVSAFWGIEKKKNGYSIGAYFFWGIEFKSWDTGNWCVGNESWGDCSYFARGKSPRNRKPRHTLNLQKARRRKANRAAHETSESKAENWGRSKRWSGSWIFLTKTSQVSRSRKRWFTGRDRSSMTLCRKG